MDKDQYIVIAGKVADGIASESELALYNAYYNKYQEKYPQWNQLSNEERKVMLEETELLIHTQLRHEVPVKQFKLWPRIAVAAAAVIGMAIGIYFFNAPRHPDAGQDPALAKYKHDIAPGGNRATLTSADGKTMQLSDAKTGIAVSDDIKYNDGTNIDPSGFEMTAVNSHSLEVGTPRGGTYSIILQDGTKVWLNADSKLKFFSNYRNKAQRIVILTGEAYFEVATAYTSVQGRTTKQPFLVLSNGQRIEVLGTHFNVSAYPGDPVATTTLLEGSITLNKTLLKPNQQAELMGKGGLIISNVDASKAIAWKEGQFSFQNEALESIMRKVGRWYDVEVIYKDENLRKAIIWGKVSRFENISKVLSKLQLTGQAKFKVEGRSVYVFN